MVTVDARAACIRDEASTTYLYPPSGFIESDCEWNRSEKRMSTRQLLVTQPPSPSRPRKIQISPTVKMLLLAIIALSPSEHTFVSSFIVNTARVRTQHHNLPTESPASSASPRGTDSSTNQTVPYQPIPPNDTMLFDRRSAMSGILASGMLLVGARIASASVGDDNYDDALEQLALGDGRWTPLKGHRLETRTHIYPTFITYATRFLINYDPGVRQWWSHLQQTYSLLPESKRNEKLLTTFGAFARSLELSVIELVQQHPSHKQAYEELWDQFTQQYNHDEESKRQITLLFAMLPGEDQPVTRLRANNVATRQRKTVSPPSSDTAQINGLTDLLSSVYMCVGDQASPYFAVAPTITTAATSSTTPFGPLGELPLIREQPLYNAVTYALLGLSGSAGCAVTHSLVIPLDVVKTRNQIDSAQYKSVIGSGLKIFKEEGMQGLFLGSQATLAGYLWYGVSVYPCYTLFKRFASFHLANEVVAVSTDSIALFAGAVASIVASVGLTPLEAARIRVVAEPDKYREIGLVGTLQTISNENGWTGLYTGFPSLVTRQVIFGSIKFLAFERACSFAFSIWPALHDETWTSLVVSLFAGAFSGALSSIISQPADAVLTHVAQDTATQNRNLLKAGFAMVATDGVGSLFRGVGSRCIWATCIIAGQFFLYDIFRTYSGVSIDDLSQIYQVVLPSVT